MDTFKKLITLITFLTFASPVFANIPIFVPPKLPIACDSLKSNSIFIAKMFQSTMTGTQMSKKLVKQFDVNPEMALYLMPGTKKIISIIPIFQQTSPTLYYADEFPTVLGSLVYRLCMSERGVGWVVPIENPLGIMT